MKNLKKSLFFKDDIDIKVLIVWCLVYSVVAGIALFDIVTTKQAHADDHGVKIEWLPTNEVPSQLEWLDLDEFFSPEPSPKKAPRDERQSCDCQPTVTGEYNAAEEFNEKGLVTGLSFDQVVARSRAKIRSSREYRVEKMQSTDPFVRKVLAKVDSGEISENAAWTLIESYFSDIGIIQY